MDKLPPITSVFLNLTNDCNLACRYCFVEQHPNYMNFTVARDAAEFLIRNANQQGTTPSITFFGGEPMLCWESVIKPLIEYVRQERQVPFGFSITTNGTLLTEEIISYLNDNNVGVMLSIDGAEETQNYNRPFHGGAGSFDVISNKISLLLKYNPGMTFRSTLVPDTCQYIFKNIMFAERCGYNNFFLIPNVFQTWSDDAKTTSEKGVRAYTDYFIESFRAGKQPIRCNTLEDGFKKILQINSAASLKRCRSCNTAYQKCGLGAAGFGSIDYKGNIYACQEMASCKGDGDPFYIGTIYSGADDALRKQLIDRYDAERIIGDECGGCKLVRICDGGCVANNYLYSGNINTVSPVYCWWMKLMLNEAARIVHILGDEKNIAFREYWYSLHGVGGCLCKN